MPGQHPSELAQQADVDRLEGQLAEQDSLLNQRGVLIRELQGKVAAEQARPGRLVAVQRKWGQNEAYTTSGLSGTQNIIDGAGGFMQLNYTPAENVWWEVTATLALMQKQDAAYNYNVIGVVMTPGDADSLTTAVHYITQHSTVQQFEGYHVSRIFRLVAGVAYEIHMYMAPSGGTWRYFTGAAHLLIEGKAWAR